MDWKQVQSIEELKSLGKLKEVAKYISDDIGDKGVPKNSWDRLWAYVVDKRSVKTTEISSDSQVTLLEVTSLESLKKYGSFKEVREKVKEVLKIPKITAKGWVELYAVLEVNRTIQVKMPTVEKYNSPYFKDEESEMIFYLLELEGDTRLKKLGITNRHYKDKEQANMWKNQIIKKIHPDQSTHPQSEGATKELNKLYGSMIKFAK